MPNIFVQKLRNYCNVLRDDGISYDHDVEQLTYLLFLKMANERTRPPYKQSSLIRKDGDELFDRNRDTSVVGTQI